MLALVTGAGCGRGPVPTPSLSSDPPWFADVTDVAGLDFTHDAGPTPAGPPYFMPQIMGSGAALLDFDGDGRLDLYLIHNGGPQGRKNRLYRQGAEGRFADASAGSGLDVAGHGMGAAAGDVNNDGRPDLLLTEYGGARLFLNAGNGTFTDVTKECGLVTVSWCTSATFLDFDRDGWLDLAVVSYVDYDPSRACTGRGGRPDYCHPNTFGGTTPRLFRNRGAGGAASAPRAVRFEDVSLKSGLARHPGNGLGVAAADFDGDGWADLFLANDAQANRLWVNNRDGTFREEGVTRGLAYNGLGQPQANMGIGLGDADGDGLFDVFVTHLTEETHALWRQGPRGQFRDQTAAAGLASPRWRGTGFGTVFADFDHDGAPDLAVANGRVSRGGANVASALGPFWGTYAEHNQLFVNDGRGTFRDVSPDNDALCGTPAVSRGLACGDVDGDGALDLLVTAAAGPARLYRNVVPRRGHWLIVRAVDPALGGRDCCGAVVTVEAGGRRRSAFADPGYSYLCANDPRAHFGLGDADRVDAIRVRWPHGDVREEVFPGTAADRVVVVRKGEGRP